MYKCRIYIKNTWIIIAKTCYQITKEEKSGKIVANQGIGKETAE